MLHRSTGRAALRRAVSALGLGLTLLSATAQPAVTVIDVMPGDSFSAIAARYTGSIRTWARLYDAQASGLPNPNLIVAGQQLELVTLPGGRRVLRLVGAAPVRAVPVAPAPVVPPPPPAPPAELVLGVLPNISAATLMTQYESLKAYLERQGGTKVRVVLPASFKAFFDATVRGDFDLAVAAPHFARVAQLDARLQPLAMYEPRINAQYITLADAPVANPADLRGKALAFANPTSLVALYGQQWLRSQGLEPGKDVEVRGARTDMGVGRMLLSGDVAAAVMSNGEFRALPPEESARLKIAQVFARIPNFIILGHPRLGPERLAALKAQLLAFPADKDEGATFMKATGLSSIVDADEATLRELDPYTAATRRAMGVGP